MPTTKTENATFNVRGPGGKTVKLAMQELWLTGQILPMGARLVVRHVFISAEKKPLEVVYAFMLPRDAALRQFRIEGEGFTATSDLQPTAKARETFEKGIEKGHLSTLAQQYGDGMVNLTVGNIRPGEQISVFLEIMAGVEARDNGFRFRFPFTMAPTYHPQARMVESAPGVGEMELPAAEFADLLLPPFHKDAKTLHRVGFDLAVECGCPTIEVASPSHPIRVGTQVTGASRISLATQGAVPDKDLIIDVVTDSRPIILRGRSSDGKCQLAAIIPSSTFGKIADAPRRVVFVLDRSGSMEGEPMRQAKMAVQACLGALSQNDSFGLVAFDTMIEVQADSIVPGTAENRDGARKFLDGIDARGGTELFAALERAAGLLKGGAGDLFVVTDGQVSGTGDIVRHAKELGIRIHVLGIGSAAQDRFLAGLAGETGGTSRYLTVQERVDMAAVELFAASGSPLAADVKLSVGGLGKATLLPAVVPAVFSGTPLVVFGETAKPGAGSLEISWCDAQHVELPLPTTSKDSALAETLRLLRGAKLITSADADAALGEGALASREQTRRDRLLESLSKEYGLVSRNMSLVAVVKRKGDEAGKIPHTQVVPVGMPGDTAYDAYFHSIDANAYACYSPCPTAPPRRASKLPVCCMSARPSEWESSESFSPAGVAEAQRNLPASMARAPRTEEDIQVALASRIEPDGGMPGRDLESRVAATVVALMFFAQQGSSEQSGPFRVHVGRLIRFLRDTDMKALHEDVRAFVKQALDSLPAVRGDWKRLGHQLMTTGSLAPYLVWRELESHG
jgi:Ca-activated chloride channel family protein